MVERVTRKNENLESELPLTISAQYGLIDQNEFFDKRIASRDVSGYYLLKKGEFAYNKSTSSDAPWGAVKRLDRYEMGVLSTLYIVFALKEDGNIDSDFLVSYYDTDCWHKGVQAIAAEGARNHGLLNITPADYFETVLTVPSNVKEQHQIGTFFAKLDSLITLHQREPNSGSQTVMENMVMAGKTLAEPPKDQIVEAMGSLIEFVAQYKNSSTSIGYTFYYYINNLYKNEDIKVLKIDGVSPDNENLLDKSYPFSSGYFAVTIKDKDPQAEEIKDYLISDEGQELVKMAGYCPIR
jgi:hypothetical protein